MNPLPSKKVLMDKDETRILSEFGSRILNEARIEQVDDMRLNGSSRFPDHTEMNFGCECDRGDCQQVISMSTEEYVKMHCNSKRFIVIPSHVQADLEEVISTFALYVLVSKFFPGLAPA